MIFIATGQLISEEFDYPRLDTLIMSDTVVWKSIVEQYAGRLNRDYEGKKNVMIYDYIDGNVPGRFHEKPGAYGTTYALIAGRKKALRNRRNELI